MSSTTSTTPPPAPTTAQKVSAWGAIAVSIFVLVIFLAALVIAWQAKSDTLLTALIGGILSMGSTVVGFWVGSSAGSQKKDESLAAAAATPTVVRVP